MGIVILLAVVCFIDVADFAFCMCKLNCIREKLHPVKRRGEY